MAPEKNIEDGSFADSIDEDAPFLSDYKRPARRRCLTFSVIHILSLYLVIAVLIGVTIFLQRGGSIWHHRFDPSLGSLYSVYNQQSYVQD